MFPLRKIPIEGFGLSFFDLPRSSYSALASAMEDEHRWHFENNDINSHMKFLRQWAPELIEWSACLSFPQGSVHLDIGSGEGNLCYIVARRGYHSIAVELSATILHSATLFQASLRSPCHNKNSSMTLWVADIYDLPLESNSVDFVTVKEVLHHLDNLDDLFREISRVLKPNGIVYVWEPFYPSFLPFRWYFSKYVRSRELSLGIRHVYHSYETYRRLFSCWLTDFSIQRKYVRTKLQHYVTRSPFFHGAIYAHGRIQPHRESTGGPVERIQIQPTDFLREDLIPDGLKMTRRRKEFLDSLLSES